MIAPISRRRFMQAIAICTAALVSLLVPQQSEAKSVSPVVSRRLILPMRRRPHS